MFIRQDIDMSDANFQPAFNDVYATWPGFWIPDFEYEDGSILFLIGA